jgi:hypothetical protein
MKNNYILYIHMAKRITEIITTLILCCSKCKYHSKCGKTLCDCEIEPQITPRVSPQPSPKTVREIVSAV